MPWIAVAIGLAAAGSPGAVDQPTPAGWTRQMVAVGGYSIALPPGVQGGPEQGVDSLIAEYRNADFRISFDFGMYGAPPDCRAHPCSTIRIDDLPATLARAEVPPADGRGSPSHWLHLRIPLSGPSEFSLVAYANCATAAGCDTALRIFQTIDFNLESRGRAE
jgi:hypothetical protein